jgi:hypothetical protein
MSWPVPAAERAVDDGLPGSAVELYQIACPSGWKSAGPVVIAILAWRLNFRGTK